MNMNNDLIIKITKLTVESILEINNNTLLIISLHKLADRGVEYNKLKVGLLLIMVICKKSLKESYSILERILEQSKGNKILFKQYLDTYLNKTVNINI